MTRSMFRTSVSRTFADLLAATNDSGSDTVITLDGDDSLTLIGVQKADLHEDDFLI